MSSALARVFAPCTDNGAMWPTPFPEGSLIVAGMLLRELATWPASPFRGTMFALRRGIPTKTNESNEQLEQL